MVQFVAHQQTNNNNVAKDEGASDHHNNNKNNNNNNNNADILGTTNQPHTTPLPHSHIPTIPLPDLNPPKEEEEDGEEEDEEEEGKTTTGYRDFRVFLIDAHKSQVERAKVIGKVAL